MRGDISGVIFRPASSTANRPAATAMWQKRSMRRAALRSMKSVTSKSVA